LAVPVLNFYTNDTTQLISAISNGNRIIIEYTSLYDAIKHRQRFAQCPFSPEGVINK